MVKKAQAASEFLTTYGWAILILLSIVAIIVNLNLFNPKAPNVCNSVSPIFCSDIKLNATNTISLVLSSSGTSTKSGLETKVTEITLDSPSNSVCIPTTNTIQVNQKTIISCSSWSPAISLNQGNRFSGTAKITYYLAETESIGLPHTVKISFSGEIES